MRLTTIALASLFAVFAVGCQSLGAPDRAAMTAISSAVTRTSMDATEAADACAESLAAFTAADVRARLDAHAVVARVEPGVAARPDRLGLTCEATLAVTWRDSEGGPEERGERVRVVAHRQPNGELAVLVHEAVAEPRETVDD